MNVLQVDVPDAERGSMLVLRLGDGASVKQDANGQLCVELEEPMTGRDLVQVLCAVERWLCDENVERTRVRFGPREYRLFVN